MYAVIFTAKIANLDEEYDQTAKRMRELAISSYGCIDMVSVTEGDMEITVSYWETEQQIQGWKQDAEHLAAQEKGRSKWYESYKVQVAKSRGQNT